MPRFLHAADVHLDSNPPKGLLPYDGAPVDYVHSATRHALTRLVETAVEEAVDVVLIAGDLYDGDWRDVRTGMFFVSQVRRLREAGILTYVIRGNHDAASQITQSLPLPENPDGTAIMLSHRAAETVVLDDHGLAVHGQGFGKRAETRNLSLGYPAPVSGLLNVGLLHTALTGGEGHEPYAPCTPEDLLARGYDYWALGHIHQRTPAPSNFATPPILFSGNIQGRHIRETGPKGCYLVEYSPSGIETVEFYSTHRYLWHAFELDISDLDDFDQIEAAVAREIENCFDEYPDEEAVAARITLTGRTPLHRKLISQTTRISHRLQAVGVDVSDGKLWLEPVRLNTLSPEQPGNEMAVDSGVLHDLAELVAELSADEQALNSLAEPITDLARKLPAELDDEARPHPDDPNWVRQLLKQADAVLEHRLQSSFDEQEEDPL